MDERENLEPLDSLGPSRVSEATITSLLQQSSLPLPRDCTVESSEQRQVLLEKIFAPLHSLQHYSQ